MLPIRSTLAVAALAALVAGCAAAPYPRTANDEALARIAPGMTREDVRQALGAPVETMRFPLSGNEAWSWYGHDTWGYYTEFSVTFDPSGHVASKNARRINDGSDHQ